MINLEIFPASYGDCILFNFKDTNNKETNILIDGGVTKTFDYFKEKLKSLNTLNLVVVTHIDEDHINGIKKLLQENNELSESKIIKIKELWFNGFKHIHLDKIIKAKYTEKEKEQFKLFESYETKDEDIHNIALKESISLTKTIYDFGYDSIWNTTFEKGPAVYKNANNPLVINNSVKIYLLTPTQRDLAELDNYCLKKFKEKVSPGTQLKDDDNLIEFVWENILKKGERKKKNIKNIAYSDLDIDKLINSKFSEDTSVSNKSSISFILECVSENKIYKMLFLGDSYCTNIINQLNELKENGYELKFNVIKVSHHGSNGNTNPEILAMIEADNFIISTNGKRYNHPDIETLLWILNSNPNKLKKIIFNYQTDVSEKLDEDKIKNRFKNFDIEHVNLKNFDIEKSYSLKF